MRKICILIITSLFLTGCSIQNKQVEEETELNWYVNFSWFRHPWGEDYVSKEISKKLNIRINYLAPNISEKEYVQSMINSNQLPDILTLGWWDDSIDQLIEEGLVHPLGALSNEFYPEFLDYVDNDIQSYFSVGYDDFYVYPNSSYTYKNYLESDNYHSNQSFLVRKDIYEALGNPDMSTQEGFLKTMYQLEDYLDTTGEHDIIPIGLHEFTENGNDSLTEHLQNFLAIPVEVNGEYYDRFTDREYVSWLKFFRKLHELGFIHDEVFFDQRVQIEEKIEEGKYFALLFQGSDFTEQQKVRYNKDPNSIYLAIDGPKNSRGDNHELPGTGIQGWTVTLVNKNTKYPEKVLELFSYLLSEEGQKLIALGVEDKEYKLVDGKFEFLKEAQNLWFSDYDEYRSVYGGSNTHWMMQNDVIQEQFPKRVNPATQQIENWSKKYSTYGSLHYAKLKKNSTLHENQRRIELLWGEKILELITSESEKEFDRIFNDFLIKRDNLKYQEIKEEMSLVIAEMKESLGMNNE